MCTLCSKCDGVILQLIVIVILILLGHFCPRGEGAMRLTLCEAPNRETRLDHNAGNYMPYAL